MLSQNYTSTVEFFSAAAKEILISTCYPSLISLIILSPSYLETKTTGILIISPISKNIDFELFSYHKIKVIIK